jgi:hypothetical protein
VNSTSAFPPGAVINLGKRAYFMGLLSQIETLADRVVPMMRAAVVGATNVENVPVRRRYGGIEYDAAEPRAHLIDTYPRSGFSGSPVYIEHPYVNMQPASADGEPALAVQLTSLSAMFGVLVRHFGSQRDNAGVAIVIPLDALRKLLDDPRLRT